MSSLKTCVFSKGHESEISASMNVCMRLKLEGMTETAFAGGPGEARGGGGEWRGLCRDRQPACLPQALQKYFSFLRMV